MGHRNPQGLYYNFNNNILLSTEHSAQGGDEININDSIDSKEIKISVGQFPLMENIMTLIQKIN